MGTPTEDWDQKPKVISDNPNPPDPGPQEISILLRDEIEHSGYDHDHLTSGESVILISNLGISPPRPPHDCLQEGGLMVRPINPM